MAGPGGVYLCHTEIVPAGSVGKEYKATGESGAAEKLDSAADWSGFSVP